jgi:hypothetical protein
MRAKVRILAACSVLAMLAALAPAGPGFASTFLRVDIPELRAMSESVVQAQVVEVRSAWNAERSMIFTHVTLDVVRSLHGTAARQIAVRVPGGTVDGFTAEMIGAPRFAPGTEVVAFIARWDDGVPMVAGYAQGLSRVLPDRAGNLILRGGLADGMPLVDFVRLLDRSGR